MQLQLTEAHQGEGIFPTWPAGTAVNDLQPCPQHPGWLQGEVDGRRSYFPRCCMTDGRLTCDYNPTELAGLGKLLGAAVFPVGLVCILLGGGELITGNMMALPVAWLKRRITLRQWARNWLIVTATNVLGAFFVAWFFGHYVGLTEGAALPETIEVALGKVNASFGQAVVSGIGCNWMVCMGLWLCYGADTFSGKILGCWFPVMVFVAIGFQHVVANMFVIPAAIWGGADISWAQFMHNMISVYIGNVLGGAVMVGGLYFAAYR